MSDGIYNFNDRLVQDTQDTFMRARDAQEKNPDDAARSLQISRGTGIGPATVNSDLETYDNAYRGALTTNLLKSSGVLRDYASGHPLSAQISGDDWGALDTASQDIGKVAQKGFWENFQNVYTNSFQGFRDVGTEVGEAIKPSRERQELNKAAKDLLVQSGAMTPAEAERAEANTRWFRPIAEAFNSITGLIQMLPPAAAGWAGWQTFGSQPISQATGIDQEVLDYYAIGAASLMGVGAAYLKAGKSPPHGVNKVADTLRQEDAKGFEKTLESAEKSSDATATKGRDEQHYQDEFVDGAHPPVRLGIDPRSVRELYGDEQPAPGDGKLGDIITADELANAEKKGNDDIHLSLGDWIRLKPDIRDMLRPNVRKHKDGYTANEVEDMEPLPEMADEVDQLRSAAGIPTIEERLGLPPPETPEVTPELPTPVEPGAEPVEPFDVIAAKKRLAQLEQAVKRAQISPAAQEAVKDFPAQIEQLKADIARQQEGTKAPKIRRREKEFGQKQAEQLELPDITRMSDQEVFDKASTLGYTVKQFKALIKWAKEDVQRRAEAFAKREAMRVQREQTAAWKSNRADMRKEIEEQVRSLPEIEADNLLRTSQKLEYYGLPKEVAEELGEIVTKGDGVYPDDIASLFNYESGADMVEALRKLHKAKNTAGMKMKDYINRVIDAYTDARMRAKYDPPAEEALRTFNDLAYSEGALQMLHEDTLRVAEQAGQQLPIDQRVIDADVRQAMQGTRIGDISSTAATSRAGRAARLLKREEQISGELAAKHPARALKLRQEQYRAIRASKEASIYEDARAKFDKLIERFAKRAVTISVQLAKGVNKSVEFSPQHLNILHAVMDKVGIPIKRTPQDLARELAAQKQGSIKTFVDELNKKNAGLDMPDFLEEPGKRDLEKLSLSEFNALHKFMDDLVQHGRDQQRVKIGNEWRDKTATLEHMEEETSRMGTYPLLDEGMWGERTRNLFSKLGNSLIQLQYHFMRADAWNPMGLMSRAFIENGAKASSTHSLLRQEFGKDLRALPKFTNTEMREQLSGSPIVRPDGGGPMRMTRKKLLGIMLHMGNPSNWTKFIRGYLPEGMDENGFSEQVKDWVHRNATQRDWDFVQGVGKIFNKIADYEAAMERDMGHMPYRRLDTGPVETAFGTIDGWYYPVSRDVRFGKTMGDPLEEPRNIRPTTPPGHYKERTGAIYPVDLNIDNIKTELELRARNIAFRPYVTEASKFFYDAKFGNMINRYFGETVKGMLDPYLQRLMRPEYTKDPTMRMVEHVLEAVRQNIVSDLVGLSVSTMGKHGLSALVNSVGEVGARDFLSEARNIIAGARDWDPNMSNLEFAMKSSTALQARVASRADNIMGVYNEMIGESGIRRKVAEIGAIPVSFLDFASAVPTWLARYRKARAGEPGIAPVDHDRAVYLADLAVSHAHGTTALTARPSIQTGTPVMRSLTSLYTFFNTMLNRQYEAYWRAKEYSRLKGQAADELDPQKVQEIKEEAAKHGKAAAMLLVTSVFLPAIIEKMIAGSDPDESWGHWAGTGLVHEVVAGVPIVREFTGMLEGHEPSFGLYTSLGSRVYKIGTDAGKVYKDGVNRHNAGQIVKDGNTLLALSGRSNEFVGNLAKGLIDMRNKEQTPQSAKELERLLLRGDIRKKGPLDWLLFASKARQTK